MALCIRSSLVTISLPNKLWQINNQVYFLCLWVSFFTKIYFKLFCTKSPLKFFLTFGEVKIGRLISQGHFSNTPATNLGYYLCDSYEHHQHCTFQVIFLNDESLDRNFKRGPHTANHNEKQSIQEISI